MEKKKRLKKGIIALIIAGTFLLFIGFTLLGFYIGFWRCDAYAHVWTQDINIKMSDEDLEELFENAQTEDDFEKLYEQTGLTKIGIDRARAHGKEGWLRVKEIQNSYFRPREVINGYFPPIMCTDYIEDMSREIYLEKGDILITSSTHFSGFRIGHSGIIINPSSSTPVFQANAVGTKNGFAAITECFTNRINFMVFRIKPEAFGAESVTDEEYIRCIDAAAEYFVKELMDSVYSPFTGIFTSKDKCEKTQCSHIIWYGFKHFDDANGGGKNIDLDPNGGLLVTPRDISDSPLVELVQTFGFDPEKLYE